MTDINNVVISKKEYDSLKTQCEIAELLSKRRGRQIEENCKQIDSLKSTLGRKDELLKEAFHYLENIEMHEQYHENDRLLDDAERKELRELMVRINLPEESKS